MSWRHRPPGVCIGVHSADSFLLPCLLSLFPCVLPQAREGGEHVAHGRKCRTFPCNSAGGESQITRFAAGLVLLPIRKEGALSLGEASEVAPEKPEGS